MGGFRGSKIKSPGNVMNCPETNKKLLIHPTPGGGFPRGIGGEAKFQKSGKFHELPRKSINCCLPPPPPLPSRWGGGLGVKIGGTDGREGLMGGREGGRDVMAIMKLTQCMWHGMGA